MLVWSLAPGVVAAGRQRGPQGFFEVWNVGQLFIFN